ncbi:hypothetical protein [Mycolicibacterium litorale]|uniref:Uncharacterized protein n=1 Tax=Mycolicibacterium litorale TaxID=758802 RepID=A0AAD1ISD4_9MYCO|nr:hypothetical protein [Mycolicibacterium litorale]MCV7417426.1 hypothetical protein [Mycolicibacterium litorale]TDY05215.1 hypothetical protein BCL50_4005 [Mycolicibacterium litorale]BBY18652.1 hypothetical protein MLIT_42440 [Mycolicibacterium litorale]
MPKLDRLTKFADQNQVKTLITAVLITAGAGGAALGVSPDHTPTAAPVAQPAVDDAAPVRAGTAPTAPAPVIAPAPVAPQPVLVSKDSGPQDIVKAIVSQGQAAGLPADQIQTVIATAKIESAFRPAVSGGVQPYGGPGTAADEVFGLFQEKASFGTVAERQDPNKAIARFIVRFTEAFRKYGITGDTVQAATLAQNPQLLKTRRGVGTGYYNTVKAAMREANDLYNQAAAPPPPQTVLR